MLDSLRLLPLYSDDAEQSSFFIVQLITFAPHSEDMEVLTGCMILVLGDSGVGKTAFRLQFCTETFPEICDWTLNEAYQKRHVVDGIPCIVDFFEMQVAEKAKSRPASWSSLIISGNSAIQVCILMYSVASRSSFEAIAAYHQLALMVRRGHNPAPLVFVVVGNKCDSEAREVSTEEGAELARQLGSGFWETSAKTRTNVDIAVEDLVRWVRNAERNIIVMPSPTRKLTGSLSRLLRRVFRN